MTRKFDTFFNTMTVTLQRVCNSANGKTLKPVQLFISDVQYKSRSY